jgi:hypothetical protein
MGNPFGHVDLQTSDVEGAKKFYTGLFDWRLEEPEKFPDYTLIDPGAPPSGGIMKLPAPQVPVGWNVYVGVDDVDGTAARAKELGGDVIVEKTPVGEMGAFAVLQDPQGGVISAWQCADPECPSIRGAATQEGARNPFCHVELMTADLDGAKKFYGDLFDWKLKTDESMPQYTLVETGSLPTGGMMAKPEAGIPTCWMTYVAVRSVAAAAAKVKELGGAVHKDRTEVPGLGWFAVVADPQGGVIGLWEAMKK